MEINNGKKAELKIVKKLRKNNLSVKLNHSWGVDIVIKTPKKDIKVEVKSAHYIVSNGINKYRKGKFYFYPGNLLRPDFFAFVIYYEGDSDTFFARGDIIRKHFENHKKKTKLSLGIPALIDKIDTIEFNEVIDCG